jgi:Glycosyltransferase family 28 C-terminal domain
MRKRVLIAPMNWGLGHASRSVPVVRELIKQGADVHLASDGVALQLLREEFPDLPAHNLPPYEVLYPEGNFAWHMFLQFPKLMRNYVRERKFVAKLAQELGIQGIIADHRAACRVKGLPSVIIAHQVWLAPIGPIPWLTQSYNLWLLQQFDSLWIPDSPQAPGLSGRFGHGPEKHKNKQYVGPLTRLKTPQPQKTKYDLLALLSGPEPARTGWEGQIIEQMAALPDNKFVLVRGLPGPKQSIAVTKNVTVYDFVKGEQLEQVAAESEIMLARGGYSTILDLTALRKKAYFVPTPGQLEQVMLTQGLEKSGIFGYAEQTNFKLTDVLSSKDKYTGLTEWPDETALLTKAVATFLNQIP